MISVVRLFKYFRNNIFFSLLYRETTEKQIPRIKKIIKNKAIKEKELGDILNNKSIEVKTDLKAAETGSVFVEYESRGKPSGISKTEADYYCFVVSEESFILIIQVDLD